MNKNNILIFFIIMLVLLSTMSYIISADIQQNITTKSENTNKNQNSISENPPEIFIEFPEDGETFYYEPEINLHGYAIDDIGIIYFEYLHEWDGGSYGNSWISSDPQEFYPIEIPLILHNGINTITLRAIDVEENIGLLSQEYIYVEDTNPPEIQIVSPQNGIYFRDNRIFPFLFPVVFGSITIQAEANDAETGVSKVDFNFERDPTSDCGDGIGSYSFKYGGTHFGFQTIETVATDNAGNNASDSITIFMISLNAEQTEFPHPIIQNPLDDTAVGGQVPISVIEENSADNIAVCKFSYLSGSRWVEIETDYGYTLDTDEYENEWIALWDTTTIPTGDYQLRAEMIDTEGYIGYDQITAHVEQPPVVNVEITDYNPETQMRIFDASGSYDPDGTIEDYIWTFWTYPNVTILEGPIVEYTYPNDYSFSIEVVDNLDVSTTNLLSVINITVLEPKFTEELKEHAKKMAEIQKIIDEKVPILEQLGNDPGSRELNESIQNMTSARLNLSKSVNYLGQAMFWQAFGNPVKENEAINNSNEKVNYALERIKDALKRMNDAEDLVNNQTIKQILENNINKLKVIHIEIECLSAKIWLIRQIGPTTHGANIPMPSDIWIGPGGSYHHDNNASLHINSDEYNNSDVVLHELDHHFMHQKDGWSMPGGGHWIAENLTMRHGAKGKQIAWSEGWATFSSIAKQKEPHYNVSTFRWNIENDSVKVGSDPYHKINYGSGDDGASIESAISSILWDLFDGPATGTEDSDNDGVSIPFKCIWKAINTHSDPNTNASLRQPAKTINEFYRHLVNVLNNDPECQQYKNLLPAIRQLFADHKIVV